MRKNLLILLILILPLNAMAVAKLIYSCEIRDPWLVHEKNIAVLNILELKKAEIRAKTVFGEVYCPLKVTYVRHADQAITPYVEFKMELEYCSSTKENIGKQFLDEVVLNIPLQHRTKNISHISWRVDSEYAPCKEILNNLDLLGIGERSPQSIKKTNKMIKGK